MLTSFNYDMLTSILLYVNALSKIRLMSTCKLLRDTLNSYKLLIYAKMTRLEIEWHEALELAMGILDEDEDHPRRVVPRRRTTRRAQICGS